MAETPEIKVTIDQDALKAQVSESIQSVVAEAAMQLRMAADALDGGAWWREHEEYMTRAIEEARAEGRASADAEIERLTRQLRKPGDPS